MLLLRRGFTLIELLVVIAIIGILASIVMTALTSSRTKSRDAARVSEMRQIAYALELYYEKFGMYPTCLSAGGSCTTTLASSGFLKTIPTDPSTKIAYTYAALGSGANCSSYHIGVALEDKTHIALKGDADASATAVPCTGSAPNFHGLSYVAGGVACAASPTDGIAQPTTNAKGESCYDLVP